MATAEEKRIKGGFKAMAHGKRENSETGNKKEKEV